MQQLKPCPSAFHALAFFLWDLQHLNNSCAAWLSANLASSQAKGNRTQRWTAKCCCGSVAAHLQAA